MLEKIWQNQSPNHLLSCSNVYDKGTEHLLSHYTCALFPCTLCSLLYWNTLMRHWLCESLIHLISCFTSFFLLLFTFIVFYLESDILSSFLFCSVSLLCWDDNKMSYTLSHIVSYSSWNTRDNNTINVKCLSSKQKALL